MKSKLKTASISIPGLSADSEGAPPGAHILSIEGLDATGKSRLACEASIAGPVAYYSTDGGVNRVLKPYRDLGRQILVGSFEYSVPKFVPKKQGGPEGDWWVKKSQELMKDVYSPYLDSINEAAEEDSGIRVIVMDTATEFWDLAQLANFGKLVQNNSLMYGPVHTEFRGPIRKAKANGKIVILIHHLKDVYKDEPDKQDPTKTRSVKIEGRYHRQGNAKIHYLCDSLIRTHYTEGSTIKRGGKDIVLEPRWEVEFLRPKMNMDLQGQRLDTPDFPTLMSLLAPNADASCWEE